MMNRVLKGIFAPLAAAALLVPMLGNPASAATPWLHVNGNWIQDAHGNNVTLRGVAIIAPRHNADCHTCNSLPINTLIDMTCDSTKGWASRVIRLPITDADTIDPATNFATYIDPYVQHCIAKGLYVIIDLHFVKDYGGSRGVPQSTVLNFWNYVAPRYANTPNVIFELYNEPINPDVWSTWQAYIQPVVNAVRTVAPNNLILMGSPQWSTRVNNALTNPITGGNIAYVYHIYPNQGPATAATFDPKFGTASNTIPIYVTEFGWQANDGNVVSGTTSGWGSPFASYIDTHPQISWSAWISDNFWSPVMYDKNWNLLGGDSYEGQTIHDWLLADQNINQPVP